MKKPASDTYRVYEKSSSPRGVSASLSDIPGSLLRAAESMLGVQVMLTPRAAEAGRILIRCEMITVTYHDIAIFVPKELITASANRQN